MSASPLGALSNGFEGFLFDAALLKPKTVQSFGDRKHVRMFALQTKTINT